MQIDDPQAFVCCGIGADTIVLARCAPARLDPAAGLPASI
jgi:hypothetical protein